MKLCLAFIGLISLACGCCQITEKQNPDTQQTEPRDAEVIAGAPSASVSIAIPPVASSAQPPVAPNKAFTFSFTKPGPEWHRIPFNSLASFENANGDQMHFTADEANSLIEAIQAINPILKHPKPQYKSEWRVSDNQNMAECDIRWKHNSAKIVIRFFPKINIALAGIAASDTLPGLQKAGFLTRDIVRSAKIRPATPEEENAQKNEKPPESTYL